MIKARHSLLYLDTSKIKRRADRIGYLISELTRISTHRVFITDRNNCRRIRHWLRSRYILATGVPTVVSFIRLGKRND